MARPGIVRDEAVLPPGGVARARLVSAVKDATFTAERIEGTQAVLEVLTSAQATCAATAFQQLDWLKPIYSSLAPSLEAKPIVILAKNETTGELAAVLPLIETREGRTKVLSFASLGVSDYGAPLLGPAAPQTPEGSERLWRSVIKATGPADLIRLANMPAEIEGRPNPFARVASARPSAHRAHALTLEGTVEQFLAARGKKYRKEAERCARLLAERGAVEFARAETPGAISHAYATLEAQQAGRHSATGTYRLSETAYSEFFRKALVDGMPNGHVHIFTLKAGGETGAVLYGISNDSRFTLLRISTAAADSDWKRCSPGRLIVLETMRYFLARGISTFDMGIGDYAFKHGFGTDAAPLTDLVASCSVRGTAPAVRDLLKGTLRKHPRLLHAAKRLTGRFSGQR